MSDGFATIFQSVALGQLLNLPNADEFVLYTTGDNGRQGPIDVILADALNGRFNINLQGNGEYNVSVTIQLGATKRSIIGAAIFVNGVQQPSLICFRQISNPMDVGSMSVFDVIPLVSGDEVTIKFESDTANTDILIFQLNVALTTVIRSIIP